MGQTASPESAWRPELVAEGSEQLRARRLEELGERAGLLDLALPQHQGRAAERRGFQEIVAHQEDGEAALSGPARLAFEPGHVGVVRVGDLGRALAAGGRSGSAGIGSPEQAPVRQA